MLGILIHCCILVTLVCSALGGGQVARKSLHIGDKPGPLSLGFSILGANGVGDYAFVVSTFYNSTFNKTRVVCTQNTPGRFDNRWSNMNTDLDIAMVSVYSCCHCVKPKLLAREVLTPGKMSFAKTDSGNPIIVGFLPMTALNTIWNGKITNVDTQTSLVEEIVLAVAGAVLGIILTIVSEGLFGEEVVVLEGEDVMAEAGDAASASMGEGGSGMIASASAQEIEDSENIMFELTRRVQALLEENIENANTFVQNADQKVFLEGLKDCSSLEGYQENDVVSFMKQELGRAIGNNGQKTGKTWESVIRDVQQDFYKNIERAQPRGISQKTWFNYVRHTLPRSDYWDQFITDQLNDYASTAAYRAFNPKYAEAMEKTANQLIQCGARSCEQL
mmetsp:Transcript_13374/g.23967  ORF Transcript_13374/g.23967 Transcript_13374/m.23967 type:complete len:390 (-) Transcript_13374:40-1209(-)